MWEMYTVAKMGFLGKCNKIVNVQTLFFLGSNLFILIFWKFLQPEIIFFQ